jgi:Ni/Co efflux regulator RcnB
MYKFITAASALAMCIGVTAAIAQPDGQTQQSTTVVQTPSGTDKTTTTTTTGNDGYVQYRKTVTSKKHYDAAAFVAPSGYTYTRFAVGDHVPAPLMTGNVTLNDYQSYALEAPPNGLSWIRNGRDALLIDPNTGEVVQADYGLFN